MIQRLIEEILEDVKKSDCENCLLVVQTEAFEKLNQNDFKAKIVSLDDWKISAPILSQKYDMNNWK